MFLDRLARPGIKVISVSSQAIASLGFRHGLSYQEAFGKVSRLLKQVGADEVLDQQRFSLYTLHSA